MVGNIAPFFSCTTVSRASGWMTAPSSVYFRRLVRTGYDVCDRSNWILRVAFFAVRLQIAIKSFGLFQFCHCEFVCFTVMFQWRDNGPGREPNMYMYVCFTILSTNIEVLHLRVKENSFDTSAVFSFVSVITKTCLYNFGPFKPHFYIVKLGCTGVYIIFFYNCS